MTPKCFGNLAFDRSQVRHGLCCLVADPVYPSPHLHRLNKQRAFTLVELVVVVVIIGILAALALPTISRQMRDRRANQAAQTVANFYRTARMRALGRGSSVLVRFRRDDPDFPRGGFQVWESVATPDSNASRCAATPLRGCLLNQWPSVDFDDEEGTLVFAGSSNQAQIINQFNPANRSEYDGVQLEMRKPNASEDSVYLDVCFTPLGATYLADKDTPMTRLTGIPVARVSRTNTPGFREILVLPNGATRVKSKVIEEKTAGDDS